MTVGAIAGAAGAIAPANAQVAPTFESATTNSHIGVSYLVAPKPLTTDAGDVLVAFVAVNHATGGAITPPAGWRLECWQGNSGTSPLVQSVYSRVAGSSEPLEYRWSFPVNTGAVIGVAVYSGVDRTAPVEGCKGATSTNTTSLTTPPIGVSGIGRALTGFAFRGSGTTTPPAGTAERFDARTSSDATRSVSASAVDQATTGSGTVGPVTATASLTAATVVSVRVALRASPATTLFSQSFIGPDGLVTNEFAEWNPTDPNRVESPDWEMSSGSLFRYQGRAWTGRPDAVAPNATSSNGTHSAVFRLHTDRFDFTDVAVSFDLWNWGLLTTSETPAQDYDGVHVFLRYQGEASLYYASVNRRDNAVAIKKKVPGGPSNGGTYYTLASGRYVVPYNTAQQVRATVQNNPNGSVTIRLYAQGSLLVQATDDGTQGGSPIRSAGATGIRGDNANFEFDDFSVAALG